MLGDIYIQVAKGVDGAFIVDHVRAPSVPKSSEMGEVRSSEAASFLSKVSEIAFRQYPKIKKVHFLPGEGVTLPSTEMVRPS